MNEFFIKKTSTQPILTMKVNKDNSVSYQKFNEMIENSAISFSMKNIDTGTYRVINGVGGILLKDKLNIDNPDEYYIYYKFKDRDVRKPGNYVGEFKIDFFNTPDKDFYTGKFIGPILSPLKIVIEDTLLHGEDTINSSIVEVDVIDYYSEYANNLEGVYDHNTPFNYFVAKGTNMPLYLNNNLTVPLNGYIKYLSSNTIIKYYNGYAIELVQSVSDL